jgi:hypothetical protein
VRAHLKISASLDNISVTLALRLTSELTRRRKFIQVWPDQMSVPGAVATGYVFTLPPLASNDLFGIALLIKIKVVLNKDPH